MKGAFFYWAIVRTFNKKLGNENNEKNVLKLIEQIKKTHADKPMLTIGVWFNEAVAYYYDKYET